LPLKDDPGMRASVEVSSSASRARMIGRSGPSDQYRNIAYIRPGAGARGGFGESARLDVVGQGCQRGGEPVPFLRAATPRSHPLDDRVWC
jgi:hypothetical protein